MDADSGLNEVSAANGSAGAFHSSQAASRIYRFGPFELKPETGELWKQGTRIKLQAKSLQVLDALLARPGELVTRDELCRKLWSANTYVDFESGLNTAMNRVRVALSDSADSPRYIETLPRLGYRFICPVTRVDTHAQEGLMPLGQDLAPPRSIDQLRAALSAPDELSRHSSQPAQVIVESTRSRYARHMRMAFAAVVCVALLGGLVAAYYLRPFSFWSRPVYRQLTFEARSVPWARFVPGSEGVLYTTRWGTDKAQHFLSTLKDGASTRLQLPEGVLNAISPSGEVVVAARDYSQPYHPFRLSGVALKGGASEVLAVGAHAGDWGPQGHSLALVRQEGSDSIVEFPAGNILYRFGGWVTSLRVSPAGDEVAFLEHPIRDDDAGDVRIVDKRGRSHILGGMWNSIDGLAWSSSGREVWFTASKTGVLRSLYAVSRSGRVRRMSDSPSSLRLLDISRSGRVLLAVDDFRTEMAGKLSGESEETDLSKLDFSHADDMSRDGRFLVFTESGEGGGQHYSTYVHDGQSHQTWLVGSGRALAISADSKWVLTVDPRERGALTMRSLTSKETKCIFGEGFQYQWARFMPNGRELLVGGSYADQRLVVGTQDLAGGKPKLLEGMPYVDHAMPSPEGSQIAGVTREQIVIFERNTGDIRTLPGQDMAAPVRWSGDGKFLYIASTGTSVSAIFKVNVATGTSEQWKKLGPTDVARAGKLSSVVASPEAGAYAYTTDVRLSRLYVVDGWS